MPHTIDVTLATGMRNLLHQSYEVRRKDNMHIARLMHDTLGLFEFIHIQAMRDESHQLTITSSCFVLVGPIALALAEE